MDGMNDPEVPLNENVDTTGWTEEQHKAAIYAALFASIEHARCKTHHAPTESCPADGVDTVAPSVLD